MSSLRFINTKRLGGLLAAVLLASIPTDAQAATGTIRGRVLDGRTDRPKSGVTVVLSGARGDGTGRIKKTTTTDASGRYRFVGLPATKDRVYALDARFRDGLFAGGVVSLTRARLVFDTTLRVWPTTDDPQTILIEDNNLFASPGEGGLDVLESVKVVNTGKSAYIGRGDGSGPERPSLGFALPPGAEDGGVQITSSDLDVPQLMRTEYGFAITAAVPPGNYLITFAYRVPGSSGSYDLSRTALYPVLNTAIHATEPLEINGPRLEPKGEVTIRGERYRRWATTESLDPGDALQVGAVAQANGTPGLTIGLVGAGLLGVTLLLFAFARRRPVATPGRTVATHPSAETREHVISLIAALDLRHRAGDVPDDEYARKRAELKDLLTDLSTAERTP
jgi:hypothetical protein